MYDPLENPRVRLLLEEAEQACQLLATAPSMELREALNGIYTDLGKTLHGLLRQRRGTVTPITAGVERPLLMDVDDLGEPEPTQIPDADELMGLEEGHPALARQVIGLSSLRGVVPDVQPPLREWLELIRLPEMLDADVAPEEASIVQWASGEVETNLAGVENAVRLMVLAMLAARAKSLTAHLDVDIGPRMAIERLRRFRASTSLSWVNGLVPGAEPETASWANDARAYWTMLT